MTGAASAHPEKVRLAVEQHVRGAVEVAGELPAEWSLAERMARYRVPGVAIALVIDGEIAWSGGYGVGDPGGAPVEPCTRFQVASISKVVAACAALALVDADRLCLDEDVNRWLKRWRVPQNRFTASNPVTLRQLLDHSAGVNVAAFDGYPRDADRPGLVEILAGTAPSRSPAVDVIAVPSSTYRYSGGGFCIVEMLIEDVTGRSFSDVARELVLEPAGMSASSYGAATGDAAGHDVDGLPVPGGHRVHPELAAAGLWSSVDDIAALIIAVQRSLGSGGLLSTSSASSLCTPSGPGARGLGPDLAGRGASARFRHGGSNRGFSGRFEGFMGQRDGVVVLTNGDGGHALVAEVVGTVGVAARWPGVAPLIAPRPGPCGAEDCAGSYRATAGDTTSFVVDGFGLRYDSPYGIRRILPLGRRHFVDEDTAAELIFDDAEVPRGFDLVVDGRVIDHYDRIASVDGAG